MKVKSLILPSLVIGSLGLWAMAERQRYKKKDQAEAAMMADVRAFFAPFGPIDVVYINAFDKADEATTGGVVIGDAVYHFTYFEGQIFYQKEKR